MACVNVSAMPLQILLRNHSDWQRFPVVVVDKDKPQGTILWANKHAKEHRIRSGMRYAAGLALTMELRGGVVDEHEIKNSITLIQQELWRFSSRVEPCFQEPGVFWLDASGLQYVFPSMPEWVRTIAGDLKAIGFHATLAIGYTRFGSYAAAMSSTTHRIFQNPEEEQAYIRSIPLELLNIDSELRDILLKLGVRTLEEFCALPAEDIHSRFGTQAHTLHTLAQGKGWTPLQPSRIYERLEATVLLDYPERQLERILLHIAPLLNSLLKQLTQRQEALASLHIHILLDNRQKVNETLSPAEPTLDAKRLLTLIRLRLEGCRFSEGVVECTLSAEGIPLHEQQLFLFNDVSQKNLDNAGQAFSKIRAGLGHDAVVVAQLHDRHLPEAQYSWKPLEDIRIPMPKDVSLRPLIRRIFSPVHPLPPCDKGDPDGWLLAGVSEGPVEEVVGPYHLSGGWWIRDTARCYHYVRTRNGKWYWIFYDRRRRRWFLQGEVQ